MTCVGSVSTRLSLLDDIDGRFTAAKLFMKRDLEAEALRTEPEQEEDTRAKTKPAAAAAAASITAVFLSLLFKWYKQRTIISA